MEFRSSPEDPVFARTVRECEPSSPARRESRLQDEPASPSADSAQWTPRRLILSTVSVNTVLWGATIFVVWWAATL